MSPHVGGNESLDNIKDGKGMTYRETGRERER
jgi:hypothetical protein